MIFAILVDVILDVAEDDIIVDIDPVSNPIRLVRIYIIEVISDPLSLKHNH